MQHRQSEKLVVSSAALIIFFLLVAAAIHFSPQIEAKVQAHTAAASGLDADYKQLKSKELRKIWNAVVYVSRNSSLDSAGGSAVVIHFNPRTRRVLLMTAAHVARCESPELKCQLHVYFSVHGVFVAEDAKIERIDQSRDEALITTVVPPYATLTVARVYEQLADRAKTPSLPTSAVAIGFPNLDARALEAWIPARPEGPRRFIRRFSEGSTLVAAESSDPSRLIHFADVLPGESGGGLFDLDGRLIAILTQIEYFNASAAKLKPMCRASEMVCRNIAHTLSPKLINYARALTKQEHVARTFDVSAPSGETLVPNRRRGRNVGNVNQRRRKMTLSHALKGHVSLIPVGAGNEHAFKQLT
jgi:hypothetical protein